MSLPPPHPLLDVLLLSGLVLSGAILVLAIAAYNRRRTRSVLLLVGALAALFGHSLVAVLMLDGIVSEAVHHLLEHALVLVQSALVLAAVYYARTLERADE